MATEKLHEAKPSVISTVVSAIFFSKSHSHPCDWRAREASETLSGLYKFELVRYIYIYMYGGTYAIIVAHATHT